MNVASLDLCKELYDLSGWKHSANGLTTLSPAPDKIGRQFEQICPAYDLGYLLRKLPGHIAIQSTTWDDVHTEKVRGQELDYQAVACYQSNIKGVLIQEVADTPEDAIALLAIKLFKQGVLTKEGEAK